MLYLPTELCDIERTRLKQDRHDCPVTVGTIPSSLDTSRTSQSSQFTDADYTILELVKTDEPLCHFADKATHICQFMDRTLKDGVGEC